MNTFEDYNRDNQSNSEVNIREILFRYLFHWKWFVISIVSFLILGYAVIKLQTPQYQIETDLLIKEDNGKLGSGDDILKGLGLFSSDKVIDNEIQILKSYSLMEKVVKALGLEVSYYELGNVKRFPIYKELPFKAELLKANEISYDEDLNIKLVSATKVEINGKTYPLGSPFQSEFGLISIKPNQNTAHCIGKEYDVKFNKLINLFQNYSKLLTINPVSKEGSVLIITYQDAIPRRGKDILNRLVYEYNKAAIDDKNKVTSITLSFITDRLEVLKDELGTAERKVENYKSGNKITDISSQSQMFLQSVQGNDAELGKVNIQLSVLNNMQDYLSKAKSDQAHLPSMLGIQDPTLLSLVTQLAEAQSRKQNLLQTIPETNPIVTTVTDQINALKAAINQSIQNLKSNLLVTKRQLDSKNATFESVISQVPSKERGLLDVMRQQEIKNTLFTFLLQKREETAMSLASTLADSRTIDEARSSQFPVKPIVPLIMFVFFLLGLLTPISVIYLREMLNNKVKKRNDISKATNAPIIAEISHSEYSSPLIVVDNPRSMVAEQIRAFRTNLQFISSDQKHKVLLFTSSISGEGKSFISLNLGASLAMSGKKVIILELDLRKPKLNAALGMESPVGLSNYLISDMEYSEIVKQVPGQPNYYILPSGPIPPNPAELLTNGRVKKLIQDLKNDFDYVIIDAPPVGLVTDAQILGEYANATFYVIRYNYTFKAAVQIIDDIYRTSKLPQLNIIFNSIEATHGYGYGYGYGYSYGYGGYYQEDKPKKRSALSKMLNK